MGFWGKKRHTGTLASLIGGPALSISLKLLGAKGLPSTICLLCSETNVFERGITISNALKIQLIMEIFMWTISIRASLFPT